MNTLSKLTLVSVAVLQSGLMAVNSAQASEVVFTEATKVEAANETPLPLTDTQLSFTETIVSPGNAIDQQSVTLTADTADTAATAAIEDIQPLKQPVEEVIFLEETVVESIKPSVSVNLSAETVVSPDTTINARSLESTAANDEIQASPWSVSEMVVESPVQPNAPAVIVGPSDTVSISETPAVAGVSTESANEATLPVAASEVTSITAAHEPGFTSDSSLEISFTETVGDNAISVNETEPNVVPITESKPAVLQQKAVSSVGQSIVPTAGSSESEVVFTEEPRLAAARPIRRQLLKSSEELSALREQIRRKAGTTAFAEKAERNSLAVLREAQESADARPQQGRLILLTNVEVEGNTVIDDATLAKVSEPFVGRRIMLSDLEELRVQLTNAYIENGYINSGVILPDQKVENGNLVYNVIEGDLVGINIEGEGSLREKYIIDRVLVGADKPFNSFALQENFQLLLDDPLFDRMDGKLRALPGRGGSVLDLDVTRARPYDFSVTTSNHGTPSLGAEQVFLSGVVRNISGFGDELGITVGGNGSKFNITTEYEIPIRSDDTRVKVRLTAADSSVIEEPLDTIDIESNSLGAEISITRPFERSIKKSVIAGAALAMRKSNNTLEGEPFSFSPGEENGRSKVTVARLWQEYVFRGDVDVFAARGTINMGLDMFGSTAYDDDRPDSDFVSAQAQLQYARRAFDERAQVIVRLEGQIASRELLPLERFSLGGANTVRGYRENELVRDQAIMASAEMRIPFYKSANFGTFQFAPFVDFGYARNKAFFINDELLASAGFGLLWDYKTSLSGEVYFGAGLKDGERPEQEDLQDRGIHLKIVAKF